MDAALQETIVGLRFNINVNNRRAKDDEGKSIRRNEIEAKYFDERGTQLLNMNEASKYSTPPLMKRADPCV